MKDRVYTQLTEYITDSQNKFYRLAYRRKYRRELPLEEEFIKEDFYYQKEFDEGLENPDYMYFKPDEGGFQSIDQNTKFYINKDKNPVIVFDKYEIAPGSMGMQEFEIVKK